LYLPEDLAVEIDAVTANGKIAQNGFRREGDLWVNDAWGTTNVTLHLKVTTGSGDIAFRTEPRSEGE
jgi:hypothetical protein